MTKEEYRQMATAFGWKDLGPQKNPVMISFVHEENGARMNVYHTTGTVTVQGVSGIVTKREASDEEFELLLQRDDF